MGFNATIKEKKTAVECSELTFVADGSQLIFYPVEDRTFESGGGIHNVPQI